MSELILKSDMSLLNDRILNLGSGLATMPKNGTMQVNKTFLTAILGYMEELLGMLRSQSANAPLTLDELRGMDGEPVYCIGVTRFASEFEGWKVLEKYNRAPGVIMFTDGNAWVNGKYGVTLLCYRRPPERSEDNA